MTHQELSEMYELSGVGVLGADERIESEEHLAGGCAECSDGVKHAIELNAMLLTLPEQVKPPKRLRRRVIASIGSDSAPRAWTLGWAIAAGCLAVALAVVGLKMGGDLRSSKAQLEEARRDLRASNSQLSKMQEIVQFLNEPQTVQATFPGGRPQPPRGLAFRNANRGVLLIASNLPPVPAGKTTEMWVGPHGGAPSPPRLFPSHAQLNAA